MEQWVIAVLVVYTIILLLYWRDIMAFFAEIIGRIVYYNGIKSREQISFTIDKFIGLMVPGDILLTHSYGQFSNVFIGGTYEHATTFIGYGKIVDGKYQPAGSAGSLEPVFIESDAFRGVRLIYLMDLLLDRKNILVLRNNLLTDEIRKPYLDMMMTFVGKPYDYKFDINDNSEYFCTEMIVQCLIKFIGKDKFIQTFGNQLLYMPKDFEAKLPHLYAATL